MARARRDRRSGNYCVVHVTNRVIEGLPFVARQSIKEVLLGIMARAQDKHPMHICGFLFMGNHYHMILAGKAHKLSPFMNFLDGEIAKAFQRLTGRYRGKFWQGRYKEQKLATPTDVVRMMAYIYGNPTKAGLVSHPKDYPNLNSYGLNGQIPARWVRPSKLKKLFPRYSKFTERKDFFHVRKSYERTYALRVEPDAWKRFFVEEARPNLFEELLEEELKTEHTAFLGARRLKEQSLDKEWKPKKKTRTPFVICHDREFRLKLIQSYKYFVEQCKEAWVRFKQGFTDITFPRGCFIPSRLARAG